MSTHKLYCDLIPIRAVIVQIDLSFNTEIGNTPSNKLFSTSFFFFLLFFSPSKIVVSQKSIFLQEHTVLLKIYLGKVISMPF